MFVATLLFFIVRIESATPVDVDYAITYRLASGVTLQHEAPTHVHVTLQGPWAGFKTFERDELLPVEVDLSKAEPGRVRYILHSSMIAPPWGMKVVAIRPVELDLTLNKQVQ